MAMCNWTVNGHSVWEVVSALQKSIRRGLERDAMYWLLEMEESGALSWALSRVRICAQEDIGLASMAAVTFALDAIGECERLHRGKNPAWRIAAGNAIRALCRAPKSREGDHFQAAVLLDRQSRQKRPIPDYALDSHTSRGKKLGRGLGFFRETSTQLHPAQASADPYETDAYTFWATADAKDAPDTDDASAATDADGASRGNVGTGRTAQAHATTTGPFLA